MNIRKGLLSVIALAFIFQLAFITDVEAKDALEPSIGTTYYVSSATGDDNNDGKSEAKAWQTLHKVNELELKPGDRVLLENGSVFQDQFMHLKGSGSAEAPLIISNYGDDEKGKPTINTNGQGIWYQDYGKSLDSSSHVFKGYVSTSLLLYDVEYIEVSNIALTNKTLQVDSVYNKTDYMNRTGVAVVSQNKGTLEHIYLDNLHVTDVIGNVYDKHMNNGGIYFTTFLPKDESKTGISRYNDIKVTNNYVENVNRWGIALSYTAYHDKFTTSELDDAIMRKYSATNVLVEGNYVKDSGGDAITLMYADRPLVQNNVSDGAARQINTTDYSDSGAGRVAAAIWPWKTKDAIFQYNEVFDTKFNQDAQAWDADYGDGTVYQYNYSHGNHGGSVMFCMIQSVNNIFRYNISYEDLQGLNPAGAPDAHVYNNTFIIKEGVDFLRTGMTGGGMVLENNIIYYNGSTPKNEDWYKGESSYKYVYDNNLYFNYVNTPAKDENAITEDPLFVGDFKNAPIKTNGTKIHDRSRFDMFKIQDDSPAVNRGKFVKGHSKVDFYGNPVGTQPDIGAHETSVADTFDLSVLSGVYKVSDDEISDIPYGTTVSELFENIVYSKGIDVIVLDELNVELDGDKVINTGDTLLLTYKDETLKYTLLVNEEVIELHSDYFDITKTTISNVSKGLTVKDFLNKLVSDSPVTYIVKNGDKELSENDLIKEGDILTVTGLSGKIRNYTIRTLITMDEIDPTTMTGTVGSFETSSQTEGNAHLALDNSLSTMWHSRWSGDSFDNLWFALDLKTEKEISVLKYIPRTSQINGVITKYEILTSEDGKTWTKISEGTWGLDNTVKYATFDKVKTQYIKLQVVESGTQTPGTNYASAAEIRVGNEVEEN